MFKRNIQPKISSKVFSLYNCVCLYQYRVPFWDKFFIYFINWPQLSHQSFYSLARIFHSIISFWHLFCSLCCGHSVMGWQLRSSFQSGGLTWQNWAGDSSSCSSGVAHQGVTAVALQASGTGKRMFTLVGLQVAGVCLWWGHVWIPSFGKTVLISKLVSALSPDFGSPNIFLIIFTFQALALSQYSYS